MTSGPALFRRGNLLSRIPAVHRNILGTIGASLAVQVALVVNGVATARILGVLDRGHSALLILLATVLPVVAATGIPLSVTYWIAQEPRIGRRLLRSLRPTFARQLLAIVALHIAILYVVFHGSPGYVQQAAALSVLSSPAMAAWAYGMAILQANQQFRALNLARMVSPPLSAVIMLLLLATGTGDLFLVVLVWDLMIWLTALMTGIAAIRGLQPEDPASADCPAPPSIRTMHIFGLKALLGSVTPLEGFQLDQAIVGLFISQRSLGIYVVAVAFTNLPRFVSQSIGTVAYPHVAAERDPHSRSRNIVRFFVIALVFCGLTVGLIELVLPLVLPPLFGASFAPAIDVARILLLSALLFGLRRVLSECARGAGRPALGSLAEALSLMTLFPAVALTFGAGAQGVAVALVIAAAAGLVGIIIGLVWPRPQTGTGRAVENATQSAAGRPSPAVVEVSGGEG